MTITENTATDTTDPARTTTDYGTFTAREEELIEGVLLAGGAVQEHAAGTHPHLSFFAKERDLLDWVDSRLEHLSASICPTDYDDNGDPEYWRLDSSVHPDLDSFRERWYDGGDKQVPASVARSQEILRILFAKFGRYRDSGSFRRYYISVANIPAPESFFRVYLDGYGVVPYYDKTYGADEETLRRVYLERMNDFIADLGGPIPGMEVKWPDENTIVVTDGL